MQIVKILEIEEIEQEEVFSPQVEDNHNYYLGEHGILSKNCQNMSGKTMQLVLSRCDKTCKVIVIGSNKQIDNMYTNKYINGMSTLIKAAESKHDEVNLWVGELNRVLRGPITEFAEKIFSK